MAKDKKYLEWIRRQPCIVTGQDFTQTDMVAHHVRYKSKAGMGQKPCDYRTVPLTALEHARLHQGVEREYWEGYGIPIEYKMMDLAIKWERENGAGKAWLNERARELELIIYGDDDGVSADDSDGTAS